MAADYDITGTRLITVSNSQPTVDRAPLTVAAKLINYSTGPTRPTTGQLFPRYTQ